MDVPGAFASNDKKITQGENGRKMQATMRSYMKVATLVDREVMGWHSLRSEEQSQMDEVIKDLNFLATTSGSNEISTEAQFILGVIYENGRGMSAPKYDRAAELYQSAAEGGCKEALYNLAGLTRSGEGIKKDLTLAFNIYETAAQLEHVNAAFNLAVMYANGEGIPKDTHCAEQWFLFASARGHKEAQKNLEVINRQRNVLLAFVMLATLLVGFFLTWFLTSFGGDVYHNYFDEPEKTQTKGTNPGEYSYLMQNDIQN